MLIYFLIFNFVAALDYLPPTRVIEADEAGGYKFGIVEVDNSTNITRCDYRSNADLSGSFVVVKSAPDKRGFSQKPSQLRNEKISNLGSAGLCQITVKDVDDKLPTIWWLKPYNNGTAMDEVEFRIKFYYGVALATGVAAVRRNEDFYQYLNTDLAFVACKLIIGVDEVNLDLKSKVKSKVGSMTVTSLGDGICGFKCVNASDASESWALLAVDKKKRPYRARFKYSLYAKPSAGELYVRKTVQVGMSSSISCGDQYVQNACYLFNSLNEHVPTSSKDCYYHIKTVSMRDLGVWRCLIGRVPSMDMLQYRVELVPGVESKGVETWIEQNKAYATIGCKLRSSSSVDHCRMVSPAGDVLNLRTGGATDRYLSIGTNFSRGVCSMKIEKPLLDSEKGQWRCELDLTGSRTTGGFISLLNKEQPMYAKRNKLTTQIGEPLHISCRVPYSSDYCYIKSPNGTVYSMVDDSESCLGLCSLDVKAATVDDVGNWSCFFARETGIADEEITIEVRLAELLWSSERVEASSGDNATMMCSSFEVPLKYCRFIAPNSQAYYIKNVHNNNRIRYHGRGLEYGECGITITQSTPADSGKWTCVTRLGGDYKQSEVSTVIDLYVAPTFFEDPRVAIGFGTAALVVVVSGAVGYVGVKKWKVRRDRLQTLGLASADSSSQGSFDPPVYYNRAGEEEEHVHQR